MKGLTTKHYVVIGGAIVALGMQLSGLQHGFHDALTPTFIGGLLVQIGKDFLNFYIDAPRDPEAHTRASDGFVSDAKRADLNKQTGV